MHNEFQNCNFIECIDPLNKRVKGLSNGNSSTNNFHYEVCMTKFIKLTERKNEPPLNKKDVYVNKDCICSLKEKYFVNNSFEWAHFCTEIEMVNGKTIVVNETVEEILSLNN